MASRAWHEAVRDRRRPRRRGRVPDRRAGLRARARGAPRCATSPRPQVLVVRDTRVSGEMLEAALCAGVAAAGGQALLAGVLPTPAASILVRRYGFDLGVVISASHNPFRDNGIKFFDAQGRKLSDEAEAAVEAHVHAGGARAPGADPRVVRPRAGAERRAGRLPARARVALRAVARGHADRARLRARRDVQRGAAAVRAARAPRSTRSAASPTASTSTPGCGSTHMDALVRARARGRPRRRVRLRRRRRPDARRGARRQRRRRRRDHRRDRARPEAAGRACRQRRRGHRDDELRLPPARCATPASRSRPRTSATGTSSRSWPGVAGCSAASSRGTSSTCG